MEKEDKKTNAFGDDLKFPGVVDHLERVAPNFSCEICGSRNWGINLSSDDRSVGVIAVDFSTKTVTDATPVIVVECQTCGNVKFLSRRIIAKADSLARRPKSSETP